MKKDIRISLIIVGTIATSILGSGFANATLFPISTSIPTDGVIMDNNQICTIACINNDPKGVRQYIDSFPAKSADKFFNANTATQEAIIAAYNKDAGTKYTVPQAQVLMSGYLSGAISGSGHIPGISGQVTYSGQTVYITNGTITIGNTIGIIDKDLNYRFSNNTRGNIRTTTGVTWAYIDGVIIDLNASTTPVVSSFTASGTTITAGQSSTLTWASTNTDKCVISYKNTPNNGDDIAYPRAISGSFMISPSATSTFVIICSKGSVNSSPKEVTVTVSTGNGTGAVNTNPYAQYIPVAVATKLDTWITTKIVSRSTTLTASNYSKFIDSVITALNKVKSETPISNKNKRYMINYLLFSLQQIQDGINDDDDFLDGLI